MNQTTLQSALSTALGSMIDFVYCSTDKLTTSYSVQGVLHRTGILFKDIDRYRHLYFFGIPCGFRHIMTTRNAVFYINYNV